MRSGDTRLAGNIGIACWDMKDRQPYVEGRIGVARIVDGDDWTVPDGAQGSRVTDGEKGRKVEGRTMVPAFGDHFRPDSGRVAERNGERREWGGTHCPALSRCT